MKLTITQLRRIIKEEVANVSDRSVVGPKGKSYNANVARYIASSWQNTVGAELWQKLLDNPDFQASLADWSEANADTLDPGVPLAQMFVEDADVSISKIAGKFEIEVNNSQAGFSAIYSQGNWTVS